MQDLGEREVALLALVQRGERGERLGGARRIRVDQVRVMDLDREPRIAEALGGEPRHLGLLRAPLARGQRGGFLAEQIDELPPLPALRVDLLEPGDRVAFGRRELDDPLERLDRVREVAEPLRP
jgi:hypothetical protein